MPRLMTLGLSLLLLMGWPALASAERPPQVTSLGKFDRDYMEQQRRRIDNLARSALGRQLRRELDPDLETLQRILDRKLLRRDQKLELQAMGVVLGDLLADELGLKWVIYEDSYGRSRALRLDKSDNYLFPVTMISRRVEADAQVSVRAVYDKARAMIEPYRTPLPFQ